MTKMPTLFLSHGSPTVIIEEQSAGRKFLSALGNNLEKPKAILIISAHWETASPMLTGATEPETIHDFYGFPNELFKLNYPAKGDPKLAQKVADLVGGQVDESRGLDHGAWCPLLLTYPEADIPVVQLSIQPQRSPRYHYDMGIKLQSLKEDGVLIIGSGAATHNLGSLRWYETQPDIWAMEFENWFVEAVENNDHAAFLNAETLAPHFKKSHPTPDHWLPLYVALGAAQEKASLLHRGFEHKNLSMAAARFD